MELIERLKEIKEEIELLNEEARMLMARSPHYMEYLRSEAYWNRQIKAALGSEGYENASMHSLQETINTISAEPESSDEEP